MGDLRVGGSDSAQGFSRQVMLTSLLIPKVATVVVVVGRVVDRANEQYGGQEDEYYDQKHTAS